ncbi:MAG: hypothetical protein IT236_09370 [Bacteroidia bacterium]|nr:hypothetical protein [Bacteroidia bacterium]
MATQISNSGVSLKITTNGAVKYVTKSSILTVSVLTGTIIKIDIGRGALYNIYINQSDVSSPTSTSVSDLRDQIEAMLQPTGSSGGDATAANQLAQTTELTNIKNSIATLNSSMTSLNTGMGTLNTGMGSLNTSMGTLNSNVNIINDKVFYEAKLVDETNGLIVYKGFANPGTRGTDPNWAIQRVTNDDGVLSYHWASGDKNFDKTWDNRASYTYS